MRLGMIERKVGLCSEFTSMQITESCYIDDCQGAFHVVRSEDLWTLRFFLVF